MYNCRRCEPVGVHRCPLEAWDQETEDKAVVSEGDETASSATEVDSDESEFEWFE